MTTTFKCHDLKPYEYNGAEEQPENLVLESMQLSFGKVVEAGALNLEGGYIPAFTRRWSIKNNALVQVMLRAYNAHWEMVFSPDDIWLVISHGLATHINANAEELRHHFVDFEGKQELVVRRDSFVKGSADNDWPGAFAEFSDQLAEYIGNKRDLIVSNFTTTGPIERAASEVMLMDAMQSYFEYTMRSMSGFSKVTVLGDAADWLDIKQRVQKLAEFGLEWWTQHLEPVIDQFVAAAQGNEDVEFWKRAIDYHGGSGKSDISGWVCSLFPYLTKGRKNPYVNWEAAPYHGPDVHSFPAAIGIAPFKWQYYGEEFPMEFLGGLMAPALDPVKLRCKAVAGWAVRSAEAS